MSTNFPDEELLRLCPDAASASALFRREEALRSEFRCGEVSFLAYVRQLRNGFTRRVGAVHDAKACAAALTSGPSASDETAKAAFAASPQLQAEFGSAEAYLAFLRAAHGGRVKVFDGR